MKIILGILLLGSSVFANYQAYYCRVLLTDINENELTPIHLEVHSQCGITENFGQSIESYGQLLDECAEYAGKVHHLFWDVTEMGRYSFYGFELRERKYTLNRKRFELVYHRTPEACVRNLNSNEGSYLMATDSRTHGIDALVLERVEDADDMAVINPEYVPSIVPEDYEQRKYKTNNSFRGLVYKAFTGRNLVD